jgi:hypothetical protein
MHQVSYFLGFNVAVRDRKTRKLSISQEHYLEEGGKRMTRTSRKARNSPFPTNFKHLPATNAELEEERHLDYLQIGGSVMQTRTLSRPDLAYY